jgi:hypothetical protein
MCKKASQCSRLRRRHSRSGLQVRGRTECCLSSCPVVCRLAFTSSRFPFAEGPLSKENPTTAADLRLLCAGKFLENSKTLKGARCAPL